MAIIPLFQLADIVIIVAYTTTKGNVLHFECSSPLFLLYKGLKTVSIFDLIFHKVAKTKLAVVAHVKFENDTIS